jgi:hypothetical protein
MVNGSPQQAAIAVYLFIKFASTPAVPEVHRISNSKVPAV